MRNTSFCAHFINRQICDHYKKKLAPSILQFGRNEILFCIAMSVSKMSREFVDSLPEYMHCSFCVKLFTPAITFRLLACRHVSCENCAQKSKKPIGMNLPFSHYLYYENNKFFCFNVLKWFDGEQIYNKSKLVAFIARKWWPTCRSTKM